VKLPKTEIINGSIIVRGDAEVHADIADVMSDIYDALNSDVSCRIYPQHYIRMISTASTKWLERWSAKEGESRDKT